MPVNVNKRSALIDVIEERIRLLETDSSAKVELIHFGRGMIFGALCASRLCELITEEEVNQYVEKTNATSLKLIEAHHEAKRKALRN